MRVTRTAGSALFCVVLSGAAAGCATATPVAPAPVSAEDAPRLQAALAGTCEVKGTQKPGGPVKDASGLTMFFLEDGTLRYNMSPFKYHYRLEGRNIVSDGLYKNIRVDDWNDGTLKLFLYDTSETYYCKKA